MPLRRLLGIRLLTTAAVASAAQKRDILHGNAARFLRLPDVLK